MAQGGQGDIPMECGDCPFEALRVPPPGIVPLPPSSVESLVNQAMHLDIGDYKTLLQQLIKKRKDEMTKDDFAYIANRCKEAEKYVAKKGGGSSTAKEEPVTRVGSSKTPASVAGSSSTPPIPLSSSHEPARSMNHSAFYFDGSIIQAQNVFAFDMEKVQMKNNKQQGGDLDIVGANGQVAFHCYIIRDPAEVKIWSTKTTGLSGVKCSRGIPEQWVRVLLDRYFEGKELWGHDANNDWISLGYTHNESGTPLNKKFKNLPSSDWNKTPFKNKDLQNFYFDVGPPGPVSLADLSEHFLGANVQNMGHSALKDARLTYILYRKKVVMEKAGIHKYYCEELADKRLGISAEEKAKKKAEAKKLFGAKDDKNVVCNCMAIHKKDLSDLGAAATVNDWGLDKLYGF